MALQERPLSPHLTIYRPQITSVLSILHRMTGVALSVGTLLLVYWLVSAAAGPTAFAAAQGVIGSWLGILILLGWSWALFYHLANGIRHMVWDTGHGFELDTLELTGWIVVGASVGLTALAWIVGLIVMGG